MNKTLTAGELRQLLGAYPEDSPVWVSTLTPDGYAQVDVIGTLDGGDSVELLLRED